MKGLFIGMVLAAINLLAADVTVGDSLNNWTWRNPLPTGHSFNSVAYGNETFVAVGAGGTIATSVDGAQWQLQPWASGDEFTTVIFANDRFVAASRSGAVGRSTNGREWERSETGQPLVSLAYAPGLFMAVSDEGAIMLSPDGRDWSLGPERLAPSQGYGYHLAYGKGVFVAAGMDGNTSHIYTSQDGLSWTNRLTTGTSFIVGIAFGQDRFVVAANGFPDLKIFTSTDGTAWSAHLEPGPAALQNLSYANGLFFAGDQIPGPSRIWTSSDGLHWIRRPTAFGECPRDFAFGHDRYVGAAWSCSSPVETLATLFHSPDGSNWVSAIQGSAMQIQSITVGGDVLLAVGYRSQTGNFQQTVGATLLSTDQGQSWSPQLLDLDQNLLGVMYGNGKFVAIGSRISDDRKGDIVLTSTNGVAWATQDTGGSNMLRSVTFGQGLFVAVGGPIDDTNASPRVLNSPDGIAWTRQPIQGTAPLVSVAFGNDRFVAIALNQTIATSLNGSDWQVQAVTNADWNVSFYSSVTFGNGLFVVVSSLGALALSADGLHWRTVPAPGDASRHWEVPLPVLSYGDGIFILIHNGLWSSFDGESWVEHHPIFSRNTYGPGLSTATFAHGKFFAAGWNGTLLESGHIVPVASRPRFVAATWHPNGSFGARASNPDNSAAVIETSVDLKSWSILDQAPTRTPGFLELLDRSDSVGAQRFFRFRSE